MNKYYRIGKTEYVLFSIEWAAFGGISKKDARELLKQHGIKTSVTGAYTIYVGHYGLWVEASKQDKASDLLFG